MDGQKYGKQKGINTKEYKLKGRSTKGREAKGGNIESHADTLSC